MSGRNRKNQISSSEESDTADSESEESFQSASSGSVISSESEDGESSAEKEDFQDSQENIEIPESDCEEENQSGDENQQSEANSPIAKAKKTKKLRVIDSDSESDEEDNRRRKSLYVNREEEEMSDTEDRVFSRATRRSMGFFNKHESDEEDDDDDEELIADDAGSEERNEFLDNEAESGHSSKYDEDSVVGSSILEDQNQSRASFRKSQVSSFSTPEKTSKVNSDVEISINKPEETDASIHEKSTAEVEESTSESPKNDCSVVESSISEEQNQSRLFHKSQVSSNSTPSVSSKSKNENHSGAERSFDTSQSLYSIQDPSENKENSANKLQTSPFSTERRRSSVLSEANFHDSIASKLSSTAQQKQETSINTEDSNSLEVVEVKKDVVDLSDSTDSIMEIASSPAVAKRIKKTVSRSFYEGEIRKMNDLQNKYQSCSKILRSDVSKLPDKGAKLKNVIETTKQQIEDMKQELKKYEIDDSMSAKMEIARSFNESGNGSFNQPKKESDKSVEEVTWDAINKATDVVPKFTGKVGMQKFQNQQVLTVEKLQTIQESLETCPAENVLAEQPKHLKIDLMTHQKHALAWMLWREGQRPRGGILADDMGLGKTLSMISLVLAKNQLEENDGDDKEDSDSGSDLEVVEDGWKAKGRKDFHDGGTLVVCPASLLKQWESEINTRVRRNVLTINSHHGNTREYKSRRLAKYDVVITTYSIVMSEKKNNGCLFGVRWNRIICDEAHTIRNHKSQTSEAVCALKGKFRWALTGTPIQNKEFDLYAVIKFLRCSPFDELAYWKTWIEARGSSGGTARLNTLMKSLMLRRTKVELMEKGEVKNLPTKVIEKIDVALDKEEMNVYSIIMSYSKTLFAQFLHQRAEKNVDLQWRYRNEMKDPNNEIHKLHKKFNQMFGSQTEIKAHQILMLLLRLRQICCHPGLIDSMLEDCEILEQDQDETNNNSGLDVLAQLQNLKINEDGDEENQESQYNTATQKVMNKDNPVFDFDKPSSKIQKLMIVIEEKILNTNDKAVIVSQWTSFLDIVRQHLRQKRIFCCELNGKVPVKDRNDIVQSFNKQGSGPKIMLLSLTAGGVGLNLVGANHLILLDLHWNPQLESQAQDRIYRFGQEKPVTIYKFVTAGTIEERILHLQEQKLEISSRVLTGRATKTKLTIDDLRGLFGI